MSCVELPASLPLGQSVGMRLGLSRDRLRRLALPAIVLVAVVGLVLAIDGPGRTFADALGRALNADPRWVIAALGFEALSFAGYAVLLWHVAGRDVPRMDLRASAQLTLAGTAASRALPTAGAGGAALTLWALRRAGQSGRDSARTLLTFLVLVYAVFLSSVLVAGVLVAVGIGAVHPSPALAILPATLAGTGIVIALATAARNPRPLGVSGSRLARVTGAAAVLSESVRDALALVRGRDLRLLGAVAWWGFDIAVLWSMFQALGSPPPLAALVLAYFLGQVANTLPLPGAVSGGTVGVLLALGAPAATALAAVLAYRAVAVWTPGLAGLAALAGLRTTVARWVREDEVATPVPLHPVAAPAVAPLAADEPLAA